MGDLGKIMSNSKVTWDNFFETFTTKKGFKATGLKIPQITQLREVTEIFILKKK